VKRRNFLAASLGVFAAPTLCMGQAGESYRRLLILVELKGGNDGLNTVVPYADAAYYRLRPRLALKRDEVLQLDARTGLHPSLAPMMALWQGGELAVVQGVGYPQPNLSHFRSIEIWDTASRSDEFLQDGWLARAFAEHPAPRHFAADGVVVGGNDLGPLGGSGARSIALSDPARFVRQARLAAPAMRLGNAALEHILRVEADIAQAAARLGGETQFKTEFPPGAWGNAIRAAAQLAANPAGIAALRLSLGGFDTHQGQPALHARLLGELAAGLVALKSALLEVSRWDSVLVMTYSEFGRRAQENGNLGTDHGTAAAHFFTGGKVRGGLYGAPPDFTDLENGNLRHALDFRSLYATALERWWGLSGARVLKGRYAALELVRS
jgi:uncharacterized protein (DUF1501 family)